MGVRWCVLTVIALAATGCGGASHSIHPAAATTSDYESEQCVPVAPSRLVHGTTAEIPGPIAKVGYWKKAFISPDRKTLLAQWSGSASSSTRSSFLRSVASRER